MTRRCAVSSRRGGAPGGAVRGRGRGQWRGRGGRGRSVGGQPSDGGTAPRALCRKGARPFLPSRESADAAAHGLPLSPKIAPDGRVNRGGGGGQRGSGVSAGGDGQEAARARGALQKRITRVKTAAAEEEERQKRLALLTTDAHWQWTNGWRPRRIAGWFDHRRSASPHLECRAALEPDRPVWTQPIRRAPPASSPPPVPTAACDGLTRTTRTCARSAQGRRQGGHRSYARRRAVCAAWAATLVRRRVAV